MIKKIPMFIQVVIFITGLNSVFGQPLPGYVQQNRFLMTTPGVHQEGLLGYINPANLGMLNRFESRFAWSTDGTDATSINDWGLFTGAHNFGFGLIRQHIGTHVVTDYRLSIAMGNTGNSFGLSYGWASGDTELVGRKKVVSAGWIFRPIPFFSIGAIGTFPFNSAAREGVAEVGFRPFGSDKLTLFADAAWEKNKKFQDPLWSAGAALQMMPGLFLAGKFLKDNAFQIGLSFNFGRTGISGQVAYDPDQEHIYNTYMVGTGGLRPNIFSGMLKKKGYMPINLTGRIDYQNYQYFDKNKNRLMDILTDIQAASEDDRIGTIALHISSLLIRPEHAWEIREELKKAKNKGKQIIIYLENAGMTHYHLASVADQVILDPQGMLLLEGFALSRTYFKGTLEKLGLGFDEWRFFKYKSGYENYRLEQMSEADREQRQDFVDDWYELVRNDVCESRSLTAQQFDKLIDDQVLFTSQLALENGLVDTLGRWSDVEQFLTEKTGRWHIKIDPDKLLAKEMSPTIWGRKPHIAIVYGLGVCDMDVGIRARYLERVFDSLEKNRYVKAIVFRVDSPGGDGMASDLVAEAIKKCSQSKPVIVSQGQVAASGGYWISMYADTIVAGPNTFTGSIGVIGGWVYDKGFGEKLGMKSDLVKRGRHGDIGRGVTLPLLGLSVPARNLTQEERGIVETHIKKMYHEFVTKVSAGRNLDVEQVEKIAEGHVYSGLDGKENGLVDEIGGLMTAIAIAKQKAGLGPDEKVDIVEIPKYKGLFHYDFGLPFVKSKVIENSILQYLKMVTEHPGQPLMLLTPGSYPEEE